MSGGNDRATDGTGDGLRPSAPGGRSCACDDFAGVVNQKVGDHAVILRAAGPTTAPNGIHADAVDGNLTGFYLLKSFLQFCDSAVLQFKVPWPAEHDLVLALPRF